MGVKTELEVLLRETVEQVRAEKQHQNKRSSGVKTTTVSGGARFMMANPSASASLAAGLGSAAEDWL